MKIESMKENKKEGETKDAIVFISQQVISILSVREDEW